MNKEFSNSSDDRLETRSGVHSIESFDRDIDRLRIRIDKLIKATETLDITIHRHVLLFEANEIFLRLQDLFFYLDHDAQRGNAGLAASEMSRIREQLGDKQLEQNQVLEAMDRVRSRLNIALEGSRIADQIYELMVTVSGIEKKLKK